MAIALSDLQSELNTEFPAGTYQVILLRDTSSTYSVSSGSVNTTTDVITFASDYAVGTRVKITGASLPSPLTANTTYWVVSKSGNDHQFSETSGGATINLTTQGSGSFTITDLTLSELMNSDTKPTVAEIVRKEPATYQGVSARPTITAPSVKTIDAPNRKVFFLDPKVIDNSGGSNPLIIDAIAILSGGSTTIQSTTGTLKRTIPLNVTLTINAGSSASLPINLERKNA
jgi:hypothetical protein